MFGLFNKKKDEGVVGVSPKAIYEPEQLTGLASSYSQWRQPANPDATATFYKKRYASIELRASTWFDYINMALSVLIVVCFVKLIFFTEFEKAVISDGTQLSCVIDEGGGLRPYTPPRAETKVLPRDVTSIQTQASNKQ